MVFTQMSEESQEGALIVSLRWLPVFPFGKEAKETLKVTARLIRFLFGKKPYLTDSSDA